MAKETGLGAGYFLDGVDLSGDTRSMESISKSIGLIEQTGIDKYAYERQAGQLNGAIDWTTYFNPTNAHLTLEDLPRGNRNLMYMHKQSVLGTPTAFLSAKQLNYDPDRSADGSLTAGVASLSDTYWLDWGLSLTQGKRSDTGATNGTGVDFANYGMPASFGFQAMLQVFSFTGTSITFTIQSSSDNGAGDAFAAVTGGAFTVVSSAPTSERIQTGRTQAVERYLRVATTGTFSQCTFAVAVAVNRRDLTI